MKTILTSLFLLALVHVQSATFTVTTTSDSGPGSLRQAISDANAASADAEISFTTSGTIILSSTLQIASANSLTINGPGTNLLTVSGNNSVQVFTVNAEAVATISGMTIANGLATGYANGAGIANAGKLTIQNCAFLNNLNLYGWGGGVFNSGNLTLANSTISGNQVIGEAGADLNGNVLNAGGGGAGMGGGLFNSSGTATVTDCAFIGNNAIGGNGGGGSTVGNGRGGGVNGGQGKQQGDYSSNGANGGFGGGGGGSGDFGQTTGGAGGFGGGGGGSAKNMPAGQAGFGGGAGGVVFDPSCCGSAGGGGAGLGGGVFVQSGTVTIVNCSFAGNQVTGGNGGGNTQGQGSNGSGIGADFFNMAGNILPVLSATTLGGGTAVVNPAAPPYLNHSLATITATPAAGWTLVNWLGDASGTNSTVNVNVTQNKFALAIFGTPLTVGSLITTYPQSSFYPYGTVVKLTALPPVGTYFSGWSGSASVTNNPLNLVITNANPSVSGLFGALNTGQSALTVLEMGQGHVSTIPYANFYTNGQTVTLAPVPDAGQDFLGWSGDAGGIHIPLVVTMTQSTVIAANFTTRPTLRVNTPLEGLVEDGFRLTVLGEFGVPYSIQASTNLSQWTTAGTVTNTYGTVQFTDPAATNRPYIFYRALAN